MRSRCLLSIGRWRRQGADYRTRNMVFLIAAAPARTLLPSQRLRAAVISFAAIAWLRGPSPAAPSALPDVPCDSRAATGPSLQERDSGSSKRADGAIRIVADDNRSPGGTLRHGVLTLCLAVCRGRCSPAAATGPSEIVLAVAEVGHRPQIPG